MEYNVSFSQFAKILYSVVGGKKYEFTIDLLKSGLHRWGVDCIESLETDITGKDRIRKYLDGKRGIASIALEMINSYDERIFVKYIKEVIDKSQYPEIINKFKSECGIIIDGKNLPEKLADIYRGILEKAAKGTRRTSFTKKATKKLSYVLANDRNEMLEIIYKIINNFNEMKDTLKDECEYIEKNRNSKTDSHTIEERLNMYSESLGNHFESFTILNLKLATFIKHYPQTSIKPLVTLVDIFGKFGWCQLTYQIRNDDSQEICFSNVMNQYESALVELWEFLRPNNDETD